MRDLKQALAETVEPMLDSEISAARDAEPHRFSAAHTRDMQQLTGQRGSRHMVHAGWRAACILLAAALLCGAAWQSERVRGFFLHKTDGKPTLSVSSAADDPQTIAQYYVLGALPEGYRQTFTERNEYFAVTYYESGDRMLMLMQTVKSEYHDVAVGESDVHMETGADGTQYMIFSQENSRDFSLVWEGEDYVFLLACLGDIDKDNAMELCTSLKVAE